MPFELLEEIAIADACYGLTGKNLDELLVSGFQALMDCIVDIRKFKASRRNIPEPDE